MTSTSSQSQVGIAAPGGRLPAVTRLGPVRLQVADLERSITFYDSVLGFEVLGRANETALLGPAERTDPLVILKEQPGVRPVPRRGRLGLFHVAYLLPSRPDLARFLRHLREPDTHVGMSDHLVSEALYLTDPDGLGIEVYADRPRDEWKRDGHEIAMATEPLDVEHLISAAGDSPWTGAPQETLLRRATTRRNCSSGRSSSRPLRTWRSRLVG
ncbi:hypothetical protein CRI94_11675 [Longibacter salinarum]|uniref:VOC domain-containing protein n=1 Tax=Longibacter salinarum TaxID=1850348 RepID=A0A2A8CXE7_9BACT|nr:VOC family protein [Longibacter salinarum]PEN13291.1 hypothetical protein CRI94_11675 [Longibacter salinarum]